MLTRPTIKKRLVAEGEIAGDYLEELLDVLDFDGDIDLDVEGNRAVVSIDGSDDLNKLVGRGARFSTLCRNSPGWRCIRRPVCGAG